MRGRALAIPVALVLTSACSRAPLPEADTAAPRPTFSASAVRATATASNADAATSVDAATSIDAAAPWRPKVRPELRSKAVTGWTDPRVVDRLEHDCAYAPERDPDPTLLRQDFGLDESVDPPVGVLLCGGIIEQTCYPVPCDRTNCQADCRDACDTCAAPCVTKCTACKAGCKDDACRRACAEDCARCHGACNAAADRCVTGTCGKRFDACMRAFTAKFKASGCATQCDRQRACAGCANEGRTSGPCKGCDKFELKPSCEAMCSYDQAW